MLTVSLHLNDRLTQYVPCRPALIEADKAVSNEAVAWDRDTTCCARHQDVATLADVVPEVAELTSPLTAMVCVVTRHLELVDLQLS